MKGTEQKHRAAGASKAAVCAKMGWGAYPTNYTAVLWVICWEAVLQITGQTDIFSKEVRLFRGRVPHGYKIKTERKKVTDASRGETQSEELMALSHHRVRGNQGDRGRRAKVLNSRKVFKVKEAELNRGEIPLRPGQVNQVCDKKRPPSGLRRRSSLRKVGHVYGVEARRVFYEPRRSLLGSRFQFRLLTPNITDDLWSGVGWGF